MKLLFISHTAARSGAPFLLLHFMRWLKANTDWELEILLLRGGPLEEEFLKVASPSIFTSTACAADFTARLLARINGPEPRYNKLKFLSGFLGAASKLLSSRIAAQSRGGDYDLVYANTAAAGHALKFLSHLNCPVLTHIHELEYALGLLQESWDKARLETDCYIAVSEAVKANLVKSGIPAERIDVVYGFVETNRTDEENRAARTRIRAELDIPENTFAIGASGSLEWRKGSDLFVELAKTVLGSPAESAPTGQPYLLWVGGSLETPYALQLTQDTNKLGWSQHFLWLGEKTNPLDYYAALDVFVLTSREDPFPLVCLEAAACGVPILCFEGAGGMPEFVEDDSGFVVPFLDIEAMAAKLKELQEDRELGVTLGAAGREKVRMRHAINVGASQIATVIKKTVKT